MKRVVRGSDGYGNFKYTLQQLALELESVANKFCEDNNLNCEAWVQVNDFDTDYDETVDVNFSVTVDIPDKEE